MNQEMNPAPGTFKRHVVKPLMSDSIHEKLCEARRYPGQMITHAWDARLQEWIAMAKDLEEESARLVAENEALRAEILTAEVFSRVAAWLRDQQRNPSTDAFTAGMERQICYALELDVLPHVRSLEERLRRLEAVDTPLPNKD
jgi:hypothetical protein